MSELNPNSRLEAFCDGVFAIAITLLVIDIKIPATVEINNNSDLWHALKVISPSIFAFVLSFSVILITWVNHHNVIRLVDKSNSFFIYSNGLLLLSVAFIPFPTSLVGEYILTDHASPAVVLYNLVLVLQAGAWVLIGRVAVKDHLTKNERSGIMMQQNAKFGVFAMMLYALCAIGAFWIPHIIVIVTTITWIFWLVYGLDMKQEIHSDNSITTGNG